MSARPMTWGAILLLALAAPATASLDPAAGIDPVRDSDFYEDGAFSEPKVALGRLLFFDKILSGNRNIACATCHHPAFGTSDGVSLSIGEGGEGLGPARRAAPTTPVLGRVPRNAPALHFLGAREFSRLFHDGRIEPDPNGTWPSGFWSPAREQLPAGLDNVLVVQAMFPVTSAMEMAGHKGENEIADAVATDQLGGADGAWARIAKRLQWIPEYVRLFQAAYPEIETAYDITFVHAANAIAAFEAAAFRPSGSPFDRYLETRDPGVLTPEAYRGMQMFYGAARCATCHGGKFQTDHEFHAIAMPQIGPGNNDGFDPAFWEATGFVGRLEDYGRYGVTFQAADRYRFRTPSLRNVELTGPWGHAGAYHTLEAVVRHHLDPATAVEGYDVAQAELPPLAEVIEPTGSGSRLMFRPINPRRLEDYLRRDLWVQGSPELRGRIAAANELAPQALSDDEIADLVAFLRALTDPASRNRPELVPATVPSGIAVETFTQANAIN